LPNHGRVAIGVRPEKILLQPADEQPLHPNGLKGTVTDTSFIGVSTHYLVRTESAGELAVVVQNLDTRRFAPGTSVLLSWEPGHTFVVGG